jgi:hypothetical protein
METARTSGKADPLAPELEDDVVATLFLDPVAEVQVVLDIVEQDERVICQSGSERPKGELPSRIAFVRIVVEEIDCRGVGRDPAQILAVASDQQHPAPAEFRLDQAADDLLRLAQAKIGEVAGIELAVIARVVVERAKECPRAETEGNTGLDDRFRAMDPDEEIEQLVEARPADREAELLALSSCKVALLASESGSLIPKPLVDGAGPGPRIDLAPAAPVARFGPAAGAALAQSKRQLSEHFCAVPGAKRVPDDIDHLRQVRSPHSVAAIHEALERAGPSVTERAGSLNLAQKDWRKEPVGAGREGLPAGRMPVTSPRPRRTIPANPRLDRCLKA